MYVYNNNMLRGICHIFICMYKEINNYFFFLSLQIYNTIKFINKFLCFFKIKFLHTHTHIYFI